jgi:hypothetical protein
VTVESSSVTAQEDRSLDPLADGEIDGPGSAWCEWNGDGLAALAQHGQGAMAAFDAESFDVSTERFGDPQPVDRQQRDERVLAGRREAGSDE